MNTYIRIIILLILMGPSRPVSAREPLPGEIKQFSNHQSLAFIENKGQITDQHYQPRPDIDFKLSAGGVVLFIGDGQLHYQWYKTDQPDQGPVKHIDDPAFNETVQHGKTDIYRMDVSLIGANKNAKLVAEGKQEYYEQYYTTGCENGATAHTYQKITYKNIYPDIDWVLYVKDDQLKYDFVVHPGGKVSDIKLKYEGTTSLDIENGDLVIVTPTGSIVEKAPYSYIAGPKKQIFSAYQLNENIVGYRIAPYSGTLIIDPVLNWATYYGGGNLDLGTSIATDTIGNVYLGGATHSVDNIATIGSHQQTLASISLRNGFVVKFSSAGTRLWATYYGGTGNDIILDAGCDASGMLYVMGRTNSLNGIATTGAFQAAYPQSNVNCAFLVQFNGAGVRQWGTYYGDNNGRVDGDALAIDHLGNIFIAGSTSVPSSSIMASPGAFQSTMLGSFDAFIAKFNSMGQLTWSTYFGSTQLEDNITITCDNAGSVYLLGHTESSAGLATPNAHQTNFAGGIYDAFIAKFNSAGNRVWCTYFGGTGTELLNMSGISGAGECGAALAFDLNGFLYVAGLTNSLTGIATPGAHQTVGTATSDFFLAQFDLNGVLQWATYYGGGCSHGGDAGLAVTTPGTVYLSGYTTCTSGIATPGSWQPNLYGTLNDMFLAKFSSTGTLMQGTYFGSTDLDHSTCIRRGKNNVLYMAGITRGYNLTTLGGHQTSFGGGTSDAVLAKWSEDTSVFISRPFNDTLLCQGQQLAVSYGASQTLNTGNVFTIQLSNAAGSFANPVTIGTAASVSGGVVICTIPNNSPPGSGYKIRVISSNPSKVSADNGIDIRISENPILSVGSNSPLCVGSTLNLSATVMTAATSFSWTGPNSFTSNLQNPSINNVTPFHAGNYTLTASNYGCISTGTTVVSIGVVNQTIGSNSPICVGGTLSLNASIASPGATYSWTGPNGFSSNQQNPSLPNVTAAAGGSYTVTISAPQCSGVLSTNVSVVPPPATPTANSNSPVCSGNNINLTASSTTPGVTYNWTGPLGYGSTQQNPTRTNATVPMSGTYAVTATVGACPAHPVSIQVVVNQTPTAPAATNNGPLCAGTALDLFAATQAGATYQWNGPMSFTSNAQNPTLLGTNSNNAGVYTVTRTVNGCTSAPGSTTVVINNAVNPAIAVFPSPNDTICPGQAVVFVASPNNGGTAPQYQWKRNGNNIPGAVAATYNTSAINTGDFFSCELTSSAACALPSKVQSNNVLMTVEPPQPCAVTITPNPGLVLSPWELVTFTATPVRGGIQPVYQWLRNGQLVIGAVSATWGASNLNSNDTISVVLFSSDPCAIPDIDTSNYLVVNIKTGINGVNGDNALTLYPNPNNGDFTIKGSINSKDVHLEVFNAIGQSVYSRHLAVDPNTDFEHTLHLDVASGAYLLKIASEMGVESVRFRVSRD